MRSVAASERTGGGSSTTKYVDFQIVLSQDELVALAARKKQERLDSKSYKSQFSAQSVHISVPYVDPCRRHVFRQDTPEKWVDPSGMKAAIKRGVL
jgi:hypothetical protein